MNTVQIHSILRRLFERAKRKDVVDDVQNNGGKGGLVVRPAGYLFGENVTRVAFKRSSYLRNFVYTFAELLSNRLSRELVSKAMSGHGSENVA
jgi:LysR family cys regulon transcriptional activator